MAEINNFLEGALSWAKNVWAERPEDVLLLGFVLGFFAIFASWRNKRLGAPGGFILALRNLSSAATIFVLIATGLYIAVAIEPVDCGYYIAAALAGLVVGRAFLFFLSLLLWAGDAVGMALNLASGPIGVFAAWLFHRNELLPAAERLIRRAMALFFD
jgi:hypothetical protein